MKYLLATFSVFLLCSYTLFTNVFDFTIITPDGNEQSLNIYQGKPLMIVILPSVQNDSNSMMLYALDSLHSQLSDSLTIIGIPSYEDNYADDSLESLITWYHSILDSGFVIAQGMNTRKASPYQSALFHWLTYADENGHFDEDIIGTGEKFIIATDGTLHGLISPDALCDPETIQQLLNSIE